MANESLRVWPTQSVSEDPLTLRDIYHWNETIMGSGAVVANLLLLWLLATEPNPEIRRYSVVLVGNALFDIELAVICMLVEPQMDFNDGYFLFMFSGVFHGCPVAWRYGQLFVWVFHSCFACCQPPITFIFRYVLIVKNRRLSNWVVFRMFAFMAALALLQAVTYTIPFVLNEPERSEICDRLLIHRMWHTGRPVDCISTAQYSGTMIGALMYALALVIATYCIMISTTAVIFRRLRNSTENMSAKTIKLQQQFNMILMVQITLPFLCSFVPVNVMALFPVFGITIHGAGILVPMLIGWVTFISPMTTTILVGSFRKRLAAAAMTLVCLKQTDAGKHVTSASTIATATNFQNQVHYYPNSQTATKI